jgi:hypothetical protein
MERYLDPVCSEETSQKVVAILALLEGMKLSEARSVLRMATGGLEETSFALPKPSPSSLARS